MDQDGLLVGLASAIAFAFVAYRGHALTAGGAGAAAVIGALTVAAGWSWAIVLVVYFITGSAVSRYRVEEKTLRSGDLTEKHGPRDARQVAANGGAFTAFALGHAMSDHPAWQTLAAGALAASAADTWATETGILARATPRSIIDWKPVDVGTSGGVTYRGLIGAVAGASVVSLTVALVRWPTPAVVAALAGGLGGCLLDSVIGATVQARRWCTSCGRATEQRIHRCGSATTISGGMAWLDNDGVNAFATLGGAALGATVAALF